jgi:DNA polymerase-3 subunit delta'
MNPFQYLDVLGHHSYFLHSFKDSVKELKEYLKEKFGIEHTQNPDFFYEKYDSLGIDESRAIKDLHLNRSFEEGKKRIFIIETSGITHEAQNSLLKIFEEPNEETHFFLIMPSIDLLLPTLRSRLMVLNEKNEKQNKDLIKEAESFLKLSKKEKVDYVDVLAKKISDDEATKLDAMEFLAALELVLYKNLGPETQGLKAILKARNYLNDRSPSIKQLLEFVALSM